MVRKTTTANFLLPDKTDVQNSKPSSTRTTRSGQLRQRMAQNYLLVWVNSNIDEKDED